MGALIRAFPWSESVLGAPEHWPSGLRTSLRILLTTQHPVFIFWGAELTCFYNDAYSRSLGPEKHPSILGLPGKQAWPEIWQIIGPQIDQVMRGDTATWHENQLVPIIRHGALQDVYWTYSYGPIDEPDAPHGVGGVLVICTRDHSADPDRAADYRGARTLRATFRTGADFHVRVARPDARLRTCKPGLHAAGRASTDHRPHAGRGIARHGRPGISGDSRQGVCQRRSVSRDRRRVPYADRTRWTCRHTLPRFRLISRSRMRMAACRASLSKASM